MPYSIAAFDTVDYYVLLNGFINYFGIGGQAVDWFQSYLLNRTQLIDTDNSFPTDFRLKDGFPHSSGSVPVLFILNAIKSLNT